MASSFDGPLLPHSLMKFSSNMKMGEYGMLLVESKY